MLECDSLAALIYVCFGYVQGSVAGMELPRFDTSISCAEESKSVSVAGSID